ncbi:MAG: hypothetical protein JWO72_2223, partial [Caulobacteraceae bacterium]|nr:hypothetical protein [Caulobacteraceae bacterium]
MNPLQSPSRRQLLLTAAAAGALPMFGAHPSAAQATGKTAAMNALYGVFAQENFKAAPEFATNLGVDVGPLADLKHRVSDVSLKGAADA